MPSGIYTRKIKINIGKTPWNKGKNNLQHHSKEWKEKHRQWMLKNNPFRGKKHTKEEKERMKGKRGKHKFIRSLEHCKKIGDRQRKLWQNDDFRKKFIGKNHHNWQGGITFLPYSIDWTKSLRISIRERDKYICKICGDKQGDYVFSVHHIDYDKLNCNPNNLITLCKKCHQKTNFNRDYWLNYFK